MRGQITHRLPTPGELQDSEKEQGGKLSYKDAFESSTANKQNYAKLMRICMGSVRVTQNEYEFAFNQVLDLIFAGRMSGRLEGTFHDYNIEEKLRELEERAETTDNLVRQLINLIQSGTTT